MFMTDKLRKAWDHFHKTGEWISPETEAQSIEQFVFACRGLSRDQIYDLFEYQIADELRDRIFHLAPAMHPEPVRFAMNLLGREWDVESLRNY